ncbi:hypothetical protein ILYODFUR_037630 [Ilyodon furcidens]|uniref:Uncharacterized protein n=1 Tax=Ilyodon furcidens TaxID=33524 RepID=A0ABV0TG91_9TELE
MCLFYPGVFMFYSFPSVHICLSLQWSLPVSQIFIVSCMNGYCPATLTSLMKCVERLVKPNITELDLHQFARSRSLVSDSECADKTVCLLWKNLQLHHRALEPL